jgi:endonuclease-8
MRLMIATDDFEAIGFNVPIAELISEADLARHDQLTKLGPDLLSATFDAAEALERMRSQPHAAAADALLDQRVMAGVGNVYKSEVLFECRISPFVPVRALDDAQLEALITTARRFLSINATGARAPMTTYTGYRRTTGRDAPSERLWVYGRARLPCRRCGTPIAVRKHGLDARLTYWCPKCQSSAPA